MARHDAALVHGIAIWTENWEIEPRESRMEAGAPHHVLHVEDTAVIEDWQSVLNARHTRYAPDAGGVEVSWLRSYEWAADVEHLRAHGAAERCCDRQDAVKKHAQHQAEQEEASGKAVDIERHVADIAT